MTTAVDVRDATASDLDAIQAVARAAWHHAYDDLLGADRVDDTVDSWFDPETLRADDLAPPERDLFVATRDGEVVGFAETVPDDEVEDVAHLYRIYVHPDHHGAGVGGTLLARVETSLRGRGVTVLRVSVVAPNEQAVGFYEASGFERSGTTRDEQFDADRYTYEKELG